MEGRFWPIAEVRCSSSAVTGMTASGKVSQSAASRADVADRPPGAGLKGLNLRVIQSPDPDEPYSLAELVLGELEVRPKFAWLGEGNCHYTGVSDLDPWHQLPVHEKIQASWTRLDINLAGALILERL